jgi:hypothetical protein
MSPILPPQMELFLGRLISSEARGPGFPRPQGGDVGGFLSIPVFWLVGVDSAGRYEFQLMEESDRTTSIGN